MRGWYTLGSANVSITRDITKALSVPCYLFRMEILVSFLLHWTASMILQDIRVIFQPLLFRTG